MAAANRVTKKKTILYRFSEKHKEYIRRCRECSYNVAEGAVRAGKTVDNVFAFAHELKTTPDKIHLATGSTMANAKMNIGDCNGMGLEWIFRGQSHWGKYKDNEALFIKGPATHNRQKIVIFAGGAKEDSYKKIRGNSYGMWIATEINLHHDNTIKEAFNRQLAAKRLKVFWDLNPDNPRAAIYSEYIDRYQRQQEEGSLLEEGGADKQDIILAKAKYQGQMQTYKDFSKKMHLPEQKARIMQDGLKGKFMPTKAEQKALEESAINDKIKADMKAAGMRGEINLKPQIPDVSKLSFDEHHVNQERQHNVTETEAKSYIQNAVFSTTKWKGKFTNYYSDEGATFVDNEAQYIRTAFRKEQYDEAATAAMEVLKREWS